MQEPRRLRTRNCDRTDFSLQCAIARHRVTWTSSYATYFHTNFDLGQAFGQFPGPVYIPDWLPGSLCVPARKQTGSWSFSSSRGIGPTDLVLSSVSRRSITPASLGSRNSEQMCASGLPARSPKGQVLVRVGVTVAGSVHAGVCQPLRGTGACAVRGRSRRGRSGTGCKDDAGLEGRFFVRQSSRTSRGSQSSHP